MNKPLVTLGALIALAPALAACGGTSEASNGVFRSEARAQTESALVGLNEGDYAQFSQDFSPVLLQALPEENFEDLRHRLKKTSGKWLGIDELRELPDPGYSTFEMTASFEKEPVRVLVWYPLGSDRMQGLWLDSENLQAYQADED